MVTERFPNGIGASDKLGRVKQNAASTLSGGAPAWRSSRRGNGAHPTAHRSTRRLPTQLPIRKLAVSVVGSLRDLPLLKSNTILRVSTVASPTGITRYSVGKLAPTIDTLVL